MLKTVNWEESMKRIPLAVVSLALLLVSAAAAVPPPAGPNFQVNQVTHLSQNQSDVAQDAAGDFVVVWTDNSASPGPDTVKIRLFTASGAAASDEILVSSLVYSTSPPRVAMTPAGEIAVAWEDRQVIYLRRFDRSGQAKGDALVVDDSAALRHSPDVGLDAAGNAYVVWALSQIDGDLILLQRLSPDNQPTGSFEQINQPAPLLRDIPRIAVGAAGNLLVSWNDHRRGGDNVDVWARRYDGPSHTWDAEVQINPSTTGVQKGSAPVLYPQGDGAVVYNDFTSAQIRVRRLDATGEPTGDPIRIGDLGDSDLFAPGAAVGPDGTTLVVWQKDALSKVHAAFFDRSWNPLGGDFLVSSPADDFEWQPAVAAGPTGSFVVTWTSFGVPVIIEGPPHGDADGHDGSQDGVFAQRFQAPPCVPTPQALCLGGRFQVTVSWKTPAGATGAGQTVPLTADTGAFWFFDPGNLELMIKVLDARTVNGYFWIYYGSLSNVEFTVTVTDTATGGVKTYHNPPGVFGSVADDRAFQEAAPGVAGVARPEERAAAEMTSSAATPGCAPTATILCETGNRFAVQVDFVDPLTGAPKAAQAVPVTEDTGVFWFTDASNLELMVKVLDARTVNHWFWVFYGALSDQEYTVTVTDTVTGAKKMYHNPAHHLASVADTRAFRARAPGGH
jgi:hypothetical protein